MSYISKIISFLLNDEKLKNSKAFKSRVYQDEPIIKTAAMLKRSKVPEKLRDMRNIAYSANAQWRSGNWIFYEQGKFMEDFEDDYEYNGDFKSYYPTYRDMSTEQLRGYFSWRTKVRRGEINETCRSFVFVYIYEILNQIGVSSPDNGFWQLKSFWESYRVYDSYIDAYMQEWLADYVIYYNLDPSLIREVGNLADFTSDQSLLILMTCEFHNEEEVFSALADLSSYHIDESKFYKEYPEDVKAVAYNVILGISKYCDKYRENSFCVSIFGKKTSTPYNMFRSAVFYDRDPHRNCQYTVNKICSYQCRNGHWICEKVSCKGKSSKLGAILKTMECIMRREYNFKYKLKPAEVTKITNNIIENEIEKFLESKSKNKTAVKEIKIDTSKLNEIREASDKTRDKLIVDEEFEEIISETPPIPEQPAVTAENQTPLNDTEYKFMQCLLYGADYSVLIKNGIMLSVLADSVNEKLFDEFGDTVIEFNGDVPMIVEDYTDDLKGMVRP